MCNFCRVTLEHTHTHIYIYIYFSGKLKMVCWNKSVLKYFVPLDKLKWAPKRYLD